MSGQRILVVDDDEMTRMLAQLTLEELGACQVLALGSGEEALVQAAAFSPDLLLLDVTMPGISGPETLAGLRQQPGLAHVPAIFLTAHTQASRVAGLRELGAIDVIAKPFEPEHLCERVASALALAGTMPAREAGPRPD